MGDGARSAPGHARQEALAAVAWYPPTHLRQASPRGSQLCRAPRAQPALGQQARARGRGCGGRHPTPQVFLMDSASTATAGRPAKASASSTTPARNSTTASGTCAPGGAKRGRFFVP
jgi:hypothetical protein